jgi:antitoxin (DNA-binding transcriptional repressor) of toxin-antitoxin stability system
MSRRADDDGPTGFRDTSVLSGCPRRSHLFAGHPVAVTVEVRPVARVAAMRRSRSSLPRGVTAGVVHRLVVGGGRRATRRSTVGHVHPDCGQDRGARVGREALPGAAREGRRDQNAVGEVPA